MEDYTEDFKSFMQQREDASSAYIDGDVQPLLQVSTEHDPATIFGPRGDYVNGAADVNSRNAEDAKNFEPGSQNRFEVLHMSADAHIAYWTGLQHSKVHMVGNVELIPMTLRVTEIFRREDNAWKLIHRHADALKS